VAVPPVVLGDHRAAGHLEDGEQAGSVVAHVVMGYPRRVAGSRAVRRGPVQRQCLGLLVYAQDQRLARRVQVQARNIADLVNELRVRTELLRFHQVGLRPEPSGLPQMLGKRSGKSVL